LILPCDQPAASRGGRPGNVPHLVATHVIAQRFKLASFAAPLRFAPRRDERAGAQRSQFNFARAPHVGIDLDGDGRMDTRLTPNQSPTCRSMSTGAGSRPFHASKIAALISARS